MTLTVTAAPQQMASPPRVLLDVAALPSVMDELQVWRRHPDGEQWRVLTSGPVTITSAWSGIDLHAPFNVPVQYQARTGSQVSAWSSPVNVVSRRTWLQHASDPDLSVKVEVELPTSGWEYGDTTARFPVLDGPTVHRAIGDRPGATRSLEILSMSPAMDTRLDALLRSSGPLVLNHRNPRRPFFGWRWIQPGKPSVKPAAEWVRDDLPMTWTVPFELTAGPDVDIEHVWTQGDLRAAFSTQAQVDAAYANQRALQLNIRG